MTRGPKETAEDRQFDLNAMKAVEANIWERDVTAKRGVAKIEERRAA